MSPVQVISIGRSAVNNIRFNDPSVSRKHCQIIQFSNGTFSIADFHSTNGTFVNGRRIYGEVPLSWNDSVRVGNINLQWQQYFGGGGGSRSSSGMSSGTILGIVFGSIAIAAVIGLLIYFLATKNSNDATGINQSSMHRIQIGNVDVGIGMPIKELKKTATVEKRTAPANGVTVLKSYNYYVVNNSFAVTLQNNYVNEIFIWYPSYVTVSGISVGTRLGDVVKACPTVQFWFVDYWFDYVYSRYVQAVYLYDPATCTGYMFYASQMSEHLRSAIYAAAGVSDGKRTFVASSLSTTDYQSLCQTLVVAQIVLQNCGCNTNTKTTNTKTNTNNQNNATQENTAEQTARRWAKAMCEVDGKTLQELSSQKLYAQFTQKGGYYDQMKILTEDSRRQLAAKSTEVSSLPAETIPNGDNKVIVRMHRAKNRQGLSTTIDYYLRKENGRWVVYGTKDSDGRRSVTIME